MISPSWICVLESFGYDRLVLNGQGDNNLPDGWAEQKVSIKRSPTYYGLFRNITTSLQFVTNGKDYIQRIYENEGTEYKINIAFYEYNELPTDKYLLFFSGLIDLSTYNIEETYLTVDINESSIARKLMSRDSVKVNMSAIESIEGLVLPQNNEVTVYLQQRELLSTGSYVLNEDASLVTGKFVSSPPRADRGFTLPINLNGFDSDIDHLLSQNSPILNSPGCNFWGKSGDESAIVSLNGIVSGVLNPLFSSGTETVSFIIRVYTDDTFTAIDFETPIFQIDLNAGDVDLPFSFNLHTNLNNITADNTISLISIFKTVELVRSYTCQFTDINFTVSENKQWVDGTNAKGYLMHEVGQRITQVITDRENSFKSNFFGRTDIGYELEGAGSLQTVHSGKQIRTIPNTHPSLNFTDWFKSVNSIYNLGAGIEYDQFNNPFIRVEEKAHFFSGEVIATIHSVSGLKKEVAREWIYNEVEVGYAKAEYEEVNGLEEYNNKFEWADSIHTIKNKLDLVSKLRADGYGIEFAKRTGDTTEDSKYDNENFTIIVRPDGAKYKNVQDENYDIVENIFSPGTAYNLDITPGRMLRNNGSMIRAGLEHYLSDPLKFQFAEQKANLKSQKTGESSITENEDIDVNTLSPGLWIAEIYSFKSILTREQLAAITKKSNGIIKFSTTTLENTTKYYYGWVLDTDSEPEGEEAEWQLLRVNTSNPDLVLIDPVGNTPEQPPIIVDPSTTYGTFEGGFEFIFTG